MIKDLEEELLEKDEDEIVEKVRRVLVVAKTKTKEEILKPIKSLIIELLKLELKPLLSHIVEAIVVTSEICLPWEKLSQESFSYHLNIIIRTK